MADAKIRKPWHRIGIVGTVIVCALGLSGCAISIPFLDKVIGSGTEATATTAPAASARPTPKAAVAGPAKNLATVKSKVALSPSEKKLWELMNGVEIKSGKVFSIKNWLKQNDLLGEQFKEADASHLAGVLSEAALRARMEVPERHIHEKLPNYAEPGFDARVTADAFDLLIYNTSKFSVAVRTKNEGGTQTLALEGNPPDDWTAPNVNVNKEVIEASKEVVVDFGADPAKAVKATDGKPGLLVKVFYKGKGGNEDTLVNKDFYAPEPAIAPRPPTPEEKTAANPNSAEAENKSTDAAQTTGESTSGTE
ncbi:VanW family protein [Gorillibacterium massiliense]|uniref:VanW family protein n=1 Tax=Gorillibacterium massiliense TaxID=1280390 RepID=UPI0004BCA02C|nr:VanW family protein [Gorillibacterium massiliense]